MSNNIIRIQRSQRNLDHRQREQELERKLEVFQRQLARLMEERIKYCPRCGEHWESVEGVRS